MKFHIIYNILWHIPEINTIRNGFYNERFLHLYSSGLFLKGAWILGSAIFDLLLMLIVNHFKLLVDNPFSKC